MRPARLLACASTSVVLLAMVTLTVDSAGAAPGGPQAKTTTTAASDTSPQPFSNADLNNTGANDTSSSNQYLSTRNGSPSQNGSGNGLANGKPCAGCVGKADNKNPQGQFPNGSDANSGYECDANHGIGQSNPAHTGCTPAAGPTTTTTPSESGSTTTTVAGSGGGGSGPSPTGPPPSTPGPSSSGAGGVSSTQGVEAALQNWLNRTPATASPSPSTAAASGGGGLAFTGSNLGRDALFGVAAVVLAGLLYLLDARWRRRRLAAPPT